MRITIVDRSTFTVMEVLDSPSLEPSEWFEFSS